MKDLSTRVAGLSPEKRLLLELMRQRKEQGTAAGAAPPGRQPAADAGAFSLVPAQDHARLPAGLEDAYPLASMQLGMLYHTHLTRDAPVPAYHNVFLFDVSFGVDLGLFERAVQSLLARHPILRTSFDLESFSEPLQLVHRTAYLPVPCIDLSALTKGDQERELEAFLLQERRRVLDISRPPLLRFFLHRYGADRFRLTMTESHTIAEGWSTYQTLGEIYDTYFTLRAGRRLPERASSSVLYRDFIRLEREALGSEECRRYWAETLRDCTFAKLPRWPASYRGPASPTRTQRFPVPASWLSGLRQASRQLEVPLKSILLAVHLKVLSIVSGELDLTTALHLHGRPEELGGEYVRGVFNNTVPFRLELQPGSWADLIRKVFAAELELLPFQRYPVAAMQKDSGQVARFEVQIGFVHFHLFGEFQPPQGIEQPGGADRSLSHFPLILYFWGSGQGPDALALWIEHADPSITTLQVLAIHGYYERILAALVADPYAPHHDRSFLSLAEEHLLRSEWNDTAVPFAGDRCMHELFEAQAGRTPDGVALVCGGRELTYAELNRRANRLAHCLRSLGVRPGTLVAVHLSRAEEMVVAVLGVLKAGGAYVPLDMSFPKSRMVWILAKLGISRLITEPARLDAVGRMWEEAPVLEHLICPGPWPEGRAFLPQGAARARLWHAAEIARFPDQDPPPAAGAEDTAYIIFTSGSTGTPKGVVIRHRSVVNLIEWVQRTFRIGPRDRVLFVTSLSFDLSVYDIFGLLATGGSIRIASDEEVSDPRRIVRILWQEPVTFWDSAPAALQQLVPFFPPAGAAAALRLVFLSGDWIPVTLPDRLRTVFPHAAVISLGGATEATVWSNYHPIAEVDPEWASIPYGRPIQNARYHVLSSLRQACPPGVVGDLYIGGECLALGYADEPALTADRFVPDPSSPTPGDRLYRTGDRARYWPDGTIEFLGRLDQQVKIRGFRIELGEIEAVLRDHPEVAEAVVTVREDLPGGRGLVTYLLPRAGGGAAGPSVGELRGFLQQRLPDYMVPAFFVVLETLPLTANGKVDRRALPAPGLDGGDREDAYEAPRTPVEALLAAIWEEVLVRDRVGAHDSFFDLGGHSLVAIQVSSRISRAFGVELPLRTLFEAPTVAGLTAEIERALQSREAAERPPLVRVPRETMLPLSFAQQRLWFIDQFEPGSPLYNVPVALRVSGPLETPVLARSLGEIVRRHEVLRTVFATVDGAPAQIVRAAVPCALGVVDLSALAGRERERLALEWAAAEAQRPFDLARGPLLRACLLRLGPDDHVVLLTMHHIVSDAWSMGIVVREVTALYRAFAAGEPSPLAELPVQYADFAVWQRAWLQGEVLAEKLAYWRDRLAGLPALLELPTDRPRPAVQSFRGTSRNVQLPEPLAHSLRALGRRQGATLFMMLLAAFQALLVRWSGQQDVSVGTPITGRTDRELEGLIGFFVNTLVLRGTLSDTSGFQEWLGQVREASLAAYAHQELPFEKLVEELEPERSLSYSPLFQAMLVLQDNPRGLSRIEGLEMSELATRSAVAKFDLTLTLEEGERGIGGSWEFNTDLFDATTVLRMSQHLGCLLRAALAEPERPVLSLPLLDGPERHQLLAEWNDTGRASYGGPGVHRLFEAQVERTPDAPALVLADHWLTYADLDSRSNRLARHLRRLGVGPEVRVGLSVERSLEMVVGLLGVLKAGGAYVPVDPAYPRERRSFMLQNAQVPVLLTQRSLLADGGGEEVATVCLDEDWGLISRYAADRLESEVSDENLAYVIYTSGSTGRPKGVALPHRALSNLMDWHLAVLSGGVRTLQFASLSFDVSFYEVFAAGASGGTAFIVPEAVRQDAAALARLLTEQGIEKAIFPVVLLQQLAEEYGRGDLPLPPLAEVTTTGEQLQTTRAMADLLLRLAGCVFHNQYGPSESHVVTDYTLSADPDLWTTHPSIGSPVANTQVHLLDRQLAAVPIGVPGELYIGGVCLARGYLDRPALTAERFVPDSWSGQPGARLYRTGDKVRRFADGTLDFLGRFDHQVKLRGFRVELEEIESVLGRHPGVWQTVVLCREDVLGDRRLVAYVVPEPERGTTELELQEHLRASLPGYMLPSALVFLDSLPLTPNRKVDRSALPAPERRDGEAGPAPRTWVEEVVASIWCEVLDLQRIGVEDDFFALGGHSLLATQVVSRLRSAFRVELPVRDLFEETTVARLAARIERAMQAGSGRAAPPLVRAPREGNLPLSFAQQRLWFIDQMEPGSPLYNVPIALRVSGRLEVPVLARCLGEIVRRHEALRTVFATVDGSPVQVVRAVGPGSPEVVDLSRLAAARRESLVLDLAVAEARRPFDLARGPLLRASVLRLGPEDHVVLMTMHHIVSDAWSMGIVVREVTALYGAFATGRPSPLAELPLQYADFAVWQRGWLQGEVLERQMAYWRQQLSPAAPVLDLPVDRPRPATQSFRGAERRLRLSRPLAERVQALSRRQGATLFMTLLAGFQALLGRYAGQSDVSIGTPIAGRNHLELEGLIGFFINTLVLRTNLGGDPGFEELLGRLREVSLQAYAHQEVPFEKLVEELKPERSLSHSPLFQVVFVLQNVRAEELEVEGLRMRPLEASAAMSKFDMALALTESGGELSGSMEYSTDLFDAATIDRLGLHFERLLAAVVESPARPVSALPLLTEAEHRQVVLEWNDTGPVDAVSVTRRCLHALFEEQARRTPDLPAVVFGEQVLTYAELDRRANRLAHRLLELGIGPEILVGLCVERSPAMVVGLLGILKAGGAYVPLDPAYPPERLAFMLEDTLMPVLVGEERLVENLPVTGMTQVVLLDADWESIERQSAAGPAVGLSPENLAYVMYTSGSTGRPKGVGVPHRGVVRLVRETGYARFGAEEVFLQLAPISFDASTLEIWGPLLNGGRLAVADPGLPSLEELGRMIARYEVTTLWLTAGLFHEMVDAHLAGLAPVRQLLAGGDVLSPAHVRRALAELPGCRLINGYGPTENTTFTCCHPSTEPGEIGASVPIGRPIAGTQVYVLDLQGRPVPAGVAGELFIGGEGLARGYFNQPGWTAERWVPDGVSGEPGQRLYRTGDRVRWLTRGTLEFLGRLDDQVKVRGFRIEPGEIEAALTADARVREAVVLARQDTPGDKRLVAYVVPVREGGLSPLDLRAALQDRLPEYMVPSAFVVLEALPLTANGKVDRKALPAPETLSSGPVSAYVAPRTQTEGVLAAIWSGVLGVERIGVDENFFDLGGHSLLATRVVSQLRNTFRVDLALQDLFEEPTVAGLAGRVEKAVRAGAGPLAPSIEPVPRGRDLPLSFAQQRLWFIDQLEPGSPLYNIPVALRVGGPLSVLALATGLDEVVRRHEALRTVFVTVDDGPVQKVQAFAALPLPVIDLSDLVEAQREAAVRVLAAEEAARPFDLSRGPLLRAHLLQTGGEEHVLLLTMHHIVSDGWSMRILVREATALYQAFAAGEASPLPDLAVQYADYAVWQRSWLRDEVLDREVDYWRQQLAGAPPLLELPTDRPRPAVQTYRGGVRSLRLVPRVAQGLRTLSRQAGTTMFMTLLAGFQALLSRYSGQRDVSVGTPIAGRNHLEVEPLIGFFVNTLVLRAKPADALPFRELLAQVREASLAAHTHQEVPFEKLVEELEPERSLSHAPLFQVMFDLTAAERAQEAPADLRMSLMLDDLPVAKFDLTLAVVDGGDGLNADLEYSSDLFDATTVDRLLAHWERLLEGAAEEPERQVSRLPLLASAERRQVLGEWNDTAALHLPDVCLHQLFEEMVERVPDAIAVVAEQGHLTYQNLNRRANQLAHLLRARGVGPEALVGVCIERSPEMIVGLLGVLKSGAGYLALDPMLPKHRMRRLLEDAGAPVILTQERLLERLPEEGVRAVCLDRDWRAISRYGVGNPSSAAVAENVVYAMYTSGSTGQPKGVVVPHRSVVWYSTAAAANYGIRPGERVLQFAPISFDISVEEIYPCLTHGAALVLGSGVMQLSAAHFLERCETWGVTVLSPPTAFWNELSAEVAEHPSSVPGSLRLVCVGGEKLLAEQVMAWCRIVDPRVRLLNTYGPTETTVVATLFAIEPDPEQELVDVPIGRPIQDLQMYVVDCGFEPLPIGVPGELCIGGAGLARGYLGAPEKTAERFSPHPFSEEPGARLYRTGDLVRSLPDGQLKYLGRIDRQVKVRGFRIELGEIEAVLSSHPRLQETTVVVWEERPSLRRLVAYVVPARGEEVSPVELREFLRQRLPEYMVPAAFVVLEALPLTANCKVDRRALPAPEGLRPELAAAYAAPRTQTEQLLAAIWGDVLGVERVGVHDDFFELGGHSLLATRVVSRLRGVFRVELALRELFEEPTLGGLAGRVERAVRAGAGLLAPPIVPVPRDAALPLSFAQQRLWFLDRLEPASAAYNLPVALRAKGRLSLTVLRRSLEEVVRRHEALRTVFAAMEGVPVQVIEPPGRFGLPLVDLSGLGAELREPLARSLVEQEAGRAFDLSRGPLLRAAVLRLEEEDSIALVTMHHIVSDGWSTEILVREVTALYDAFAAGRPSPLSDLPLQYADFAAWQRGWLQGAVLEEKLAYWRRQLADLPALLELPADRPRPAVQSFRGQALSLQLPEPLSEALRALSRGQGVTLFMTLLAAFMALLARCSGRSDVSVGTPTAGRTHEELEGLIGFFVNTLVLRGDLSWDPELREVLSRVREVSLAAHMHQEVPFEKLVEELEPERSLAYSPLFQVMFALQNMPYKALEIEELRIEPVDLPGVTAKFDLTLALEERPALSGRLEYNTDLFDRTTLARMAGHFVRLLEGVVENGGRRLSELPLLTAAEARQLLVEWNDTRVADRKSCCLHDLFRDQAERTPDAVALVSGDREMSYGELDRRAERLGRRLREMGIGPEAIVGVCTSRSLDMVIGLLGVLKAGGAYLPLDPSYPRERLEFMLEDTGVSVLLTEEPLLGKLGRVAGKVVCLDRKRTDEGARSWASPVPAVHDLHLGYVIYTSGSTGRPKGVAISHRSAVTLVRWAGEQYDREDLAGVLASTSLCFDLSVFEIFAPLSWGGTVLLVENVLDLPQPWIDGRLTLINTVPSAIWALLDSSALPGPVRTLNLAGEPLSGSLAERIHETGAARRVYNLYGPSEDTTYSTFARVESGAAAAPSIGRPIAGTHVYVLDAHLRPVPVGVPGELHLGGAGLARGYFGRPELTGEAFIPDPFAGEPGERLYRTGDLARWLPQGELEFLGRPDQQVKVRGFRIELGEIETVLARHPAVRETAVVVREEGTGEKQLVAYLVPAGEEALAKSALREHLADTLPHYMVPASFVTLDRMPLTPNGKVDRKALPAPDRTSSGQQADAPLAPRDALELQLAQLWEELLQVHPVGVAGDFFQLGGHSLLAVRLIARIQSCLGVELPLAVLFQAPTVERLAGLLRNRQAPASRSLVVPIQAHGSLPPFFCVHAAGGHVFCYRELARCLGPDQPFYGLQAPRGTSMEQGQERIEDLAALYLEELRTVQPGGPYLLGGWSVGGVIALEMARQLRERGEKVGLLALIDPSNPQDGGSCQELETTDLISWFIRDLWGIPGQEIPLGVTAPRSLEAGEVWSSLLEQAREARLVPPDLGLEQVLELFAVFSRNVRALSRYRAMGCPVPTALFLAEEDRGPALARSGWEADGIDVFRVPGSHYSVLKSPQVEVLAQHLRDCLSLRAGWPRDAVTRGFDPGGAI